MAMLGEVDDGETAMSERNTGLRINPSSAAVWATVPDPRSHRDDALLLHVGGMGPGRINKAAEAAHTSSVPRECDGKPGAVGAQRYQSRALAHRQQRAEAAREGHETITARQSGARPHAGIARMYGESGPQRTHAAFSAPACR